MTHVAIRVVEFVDGSAYPNVIAAELTDADGRIHRIMEKVPVLTYEDLDEGSAYPLDLTTPCEVLRWSESSGRRLAHITLARPWGLESTAGISEFVVLESQLSEHSD